MMAISPITANNAITLETRAESDRVRKFGRSVRLRVAGLPSGAGSGSGAGSIAGVASPVHAGSGAGATLGVGNGVTCSVKSIASRWQVWRRNNTSALRDISETQNEGLAPRGLVRVK
jgi:hypothetical protein